MFSYNSSQGIIKVKIDLDDVQEVKRDKGGTVITERSIFLYGKLNENHKLRRA